MAVADLAKQVEWVIKERYIETCDGPPCSGFRVGAALDENESSYTYISYTWAAPNEEDAIASVISHLRTVPLGSRLVWRKRPEVGAVEGETKENRIKIYGDAAKDESDFPLTPPHWRSNFRYIIVDARDFDAAKNWSRRGAH